MTVDKYMRIIFSTYDEPDNPFYAGGGANAVLEIAKRFAVPNEVIVICGNYENARDRKISNVQIKHIGPKFLGGKLGQLVFQLLLPLQVIKFEFDVWIESFTPPFSTSFLPLFTRKQVIGLVHMLAGADMRRKYKLPFDRIEKVGLKVYKKIIVVNAKTGEYISRINPACDIKVIPNGVNMPELKYTKGKSYILFLGRIEVNQKGLDLLLNAFALVRKKVNIDLVIAGSGIKNERSKLLDLIVKLGLSENVKIVSYVKNLKKDKIFRIKADAGKNSPF